MPTISVKKNKLHKALNKPLSEDITEILFDFGLEIDDVVIENDETIYKIEVGANRYDLLCFEGISRALNAYLEIEKYSEIMIDDNHSIQKLTIPNKKESGIAADLKLDQYDQKYLSCLDTVVQQNTKERPYIACAIIWGIDLKNDTYDSFIDYQDKLHSSLGRNRSIIAIGTHDLNKVEFPVFYKKLPKESIKFAPLNQKIMTGPELLKFYGQDSKMKSYCKMLKEEFPAFVDAHGHILSIPPLINGDYSKISQETTSMFVEVTGTDFHKVNTALKLVLYNFRGSGYTPLTINIVNGPNSTQTNKPGCCLEDHMHEHKEEKYDISGLSLKNKIVTKNDKTKVTPYFFNNRYIFTVDEINKELGINLSKLEIEKLLKRMMHYIVPQKSGNSKNDQIEVVVSDVRNDILHKVDIFEDIAIAYGYNNFIKSNPPVLTMGRENSLAKFTNKIRHECAQAGYDEVLTLSLLSKKDSKGQCVTLSNPKSLECEVVRNSLLPGILKSVSSNQHTGVPMKVFEVSDVVIKQDVMVKNQTNLCACFVSKTDCLDNVIGLCSLIFKKIGLNYELKEADSAIYFAKRSVNILVKDTIVGTLGVLHPKMCIDFKIPFAISSFEINLGSIYRIKNNK